MDRDVSGLAQLPAELLHNIAHHLQGQDCLSLGRACSRIYRAIVPALYANIETANYERPVQLVRSITARPFLANYPRRITLWAGDTYPGPDEAQYCEPLRQLFKTKLPNLRTLMLYGNFLTDLRDPDGAGIQEVVDGIMSQPRLEHLYHYEHLIDSRYCKESTQILRVLHHPTLRTLTLRGLSLRDQDMRDVPAMDHVRRGTNPRRPLHLRLWACVFDLGQLRTIVRHVDYLAGFWFRHSEYDSALYSADVYPAINGYLDALKPAASTLETLCLDFEEFWLRAYSADDVDMHEFVALKHLRISTSFLLLFNDEDFARAMPPNLEHLALDSYYLGGSSSSSHVMRLLGAKESVPHLKRLTLHVNFYSGKEVIPRDVLLAAKSASVTVDLAASSGDPNRERLAWLRTDW